jgi:hypothetical protein
MPLVPLLFAIGGATLAASLFAPWFEVTAVEFSGFEPPDPATVDRISDGLRQTGWEWWDVADVPLFLLGAGLVALAIYDAVRHRVPAPALAVAALLTAAGLAVVLGWGFSGDAVAFPDGALGEAAGEVRFDRSRAGGQWVALTGLLVALAALGAGWRERRAAAATPP